MTSEILRNTAEILALQSIVYVTGDPSVTIDSTADELCLDSLDCLEIILALESALKQEIDDDDVWQFTSVKELVNYIEEILKKMHEQEQ